MREDANGRVLLGLTQPPKRKPSPGNASSSRKKKKNHDRRPERSRYFEEPDPFRIQEDIIAINDSDTSDEGDIEEPEPVQRSWSPSAPLNDSSDEEDEGPAPVPALRPPPTISEEINTLSTFCPIRDQNTFTLAPDEFGSFGLGDGAAILLALSASDTICFLGAYKLSVLHGSITVCGTTLQSPSRVHHVFAPRSSPLPVIAVETESRAGPSKISTLPPRFQSLLATADALIVVQELQTNVSGLEVICRAFDRVFSPYRRNDEDAFDFGVPGVHMVSRRTKHSEPFCLPLSWSSALSSASAAEVDASEVYVVEGPKKTGKSTFARTLVNRLLARYQRVAYLECDLGQSEFTPGGMVALNIIESPLFGPPFTHPTLPIHAHYIGATTPKSSPSHYLSAIQSLVQSYRLDIQIPTDMGIEGDDDRTCDRIPLVVNTMGWTKGLGADLLQKIHDMVEPTQIFEFEAPIIDNAWPARAPAHHLLKPIPSLNLYSAVDTRSLSIMSYFHAVFPSAIGPGAFRQITATRWNTSLPLCARRPYEVDISVAVDRVILTGAGMEDVRPSEIQCVLNGALVGLVSCEPDTPLDGIPYIQGALPPSPEVSSCYGLALIRSLSPKVLHVLTPTPPASLHKTRVLVKGEMELPIWGLLDFRTDNDEVAGVEKGKVPFLQWGKREGLGAEKRRVRRNLMRRGQM
ncbi:uncharacterized protein BT62DRAFT_907889 [Guyanagaster necrorhizus]|uniref:Polynucleotide 5'-hydroxyl-kinase GRC3 n=1 Tax=Guyanagaster necrorhizus TaxID=856835 RepID=A0A9P8AP93_9AGAR|nr:uncharacterized protein BT62DRAFT_907889 [Guyanagaster necrorhizus MCA 3950]KAG7441622.1 hypothetical protein BT62DRAFT_907889 [Guyanagaster necrorhizus MCA 3950]